MRRLALISSFIAVACEGSPGGTDTSSPAETESGATASASASASASGSASGSATASAGTTGDTASDSDSVTGDDSDTMTSADPTSDTAESGSGDDGPPIMPHEAFEDLADNTLLSLGPIDCTNPEGEDGNSCDIATDFSGMTYDEGRHRMYVFGGGHASTMTDAVQSFDLQDTLAWSDLYTPTPCGDMVGSNLDNALGAWLSGADGPYPRPVSAHTYDLIGVAAELDEFVVVGRAFTGGYCSQAGNDIGGPVAHYDLAGGTWEFSGDASSGGFTNGLPGAERDPVSGYFIAIGEYGLAAYDPVSRTMVAEDDTLETSEGETFDQAAWLGYANHMVYFPPEDRFYFFARGTPVEVFAVTLDRDNLNATTVDRVTTRGPTSGHQEPGYDYDAVNDIIGGGVSDGVFYAFDPATATWTAETMQGGSPGNMAFHAIAYSPVDNVFIFRTTNETWAYRYRN